ncbi:SDR family oxidoreductase [Microlunatus aurantiacus]|uniref:SDR family oxidoreductase n=1 Tax=Microlunatus aurantiacus TaxID=446786 RepID=A0ABP7D428_9ACTN
MIALTGATGAIGSRVARLLAEQDQPLRLLVRDATRAPQLGAEVAVFAGYTDGDGARAGLRGCDTMLLVSGRESPDRVGEHRAMVEAAGDAGVRKIVYLSFQGAAPEATFTFARDHFHTEQLIASSGLDHVFLRDSLYLSALAGLAGDDGVIRGPAGDGAVAAVSHDDVAAVAARVLVEARWQGATLDVTGPAALTLTEVAAELSSVSGREVRYIPESEDEAYASRRGYGAPDFEVTGWVSSYQAIANGEVATVSDTVEQVTGRSPQSLRDVLRTDPGCWAHLAPRDAP